MSGAYADLHTHTRASDGTEPPASNVRAALASGLSAVAITDHDTVAGVAEAEAEGRRLGVEVVPGVEISTAAGGRDIHVLGYYIDTGDAELLGRLERLRNVRERRNELIVARLRELGCAVTMAEVVTGAVGKKADETIGRPHIAALLLKKGYVASMQEAFDRYLGERGAAYVAPERIAPQEAAAWIHEAGGAAVLAHPGLYGDDELVRGLLASGAFDGVEAHHSDHSPEEAARYARMAADYGVVATAGSDFHGERHGHTFHGAIGSQRVDAAVLDVLRSAAGRRALQRDPHV